MMKRIEATPKVFKRELVSDFDGPRVGPGRAGALGSGAHDASHADEQQLSVCIGGI